MAMNKKEKAYVEELLVIKSLRWSENVEPDLAPPGNCSFTDEKLSKGYWFNDYSCTISEACSSSIYHNTCANDRTTSQNSKWLYSTKELACKALRHSVMMRLARELRGVDLAIEKILEEE